MIILIVAQPVEHLISLPEVSKQVDLSEREIVRRVKAGTFPQPARLGCSVKWSQSEVSGFIQAVLDSRDRMAS